MSFHFGTPIWLLLLPAVVLVARSMRNRKDTPVRYSSLRLVKLGRISPMVRARQSLILLRAAALIFFILAMARPQSGRKLVEISSEGVDIILAIDASRSMEAMDFKLKGAPASRLEVVKKVVQDFVMGQSTNRLGLVVFGSEAFTQCPLTLDYGVLMSFIERLETGIAGDATAIGSALSVATKRVKDIDAKSKVIILLTDGASNAGPVGPLDAARAADVLGVKIYTVGIGTDGMAPMPRRTLLGTIFEAVKVEFDEDTLIEIAAITHGAYFKATDTDSLEKIYATIDGLEKTEKTVKEHMEFDELYHWFLMAGLLLLLLELVLANTRFRKLP